VGRWKRDKGESLLIQQREARRNTAKGCNAKAISELGTAQKKK